MIQGSVEYFFLLKDFVYIYNTYRIQEEKNNTKQQPVEALGPKETLAHPTPLSWPSGQISPVLSLRFFIFIFLYDFLKIYITQLFLQTCHSVATSSGVSMLLPFETVKR